MVKEKESEKRKEVRKDTKKEEIMSKVHNTILKKEWREQRELQDKYKIKCLKNIE